MADWLNWLGLARRAGKLAPGDHQVETAMNERTAKAIIVAEDAGRAVYRKYHLWAQDRGVPIVRAGTKVEIGRAIGMGPHAILAVLDANLAERCVQAIGKETGGMDFGGKGKRQDSGLRVSQRAEAGQQAADRPLAPTARGEHQKPHEHGRAGGGADRPRHHGGKASARARAKAATGSGPSRERTAAGRSGGGRASSSGRRGDESSRRR